MTAPIGKRGPGRPRKSPPPVDDEQVELASELKARKAALSVAMQALQAERTVAARLEVLHCRADLAGAQAGLLRAQDQHGMALRYDETGIKWHREITALSEIVNFDRVQELETKRSAKNTSALGKKRR